MSSSTEASVSVSVFSQPSLSNLHLLRPEDESLPSPDPSETLPHASVLARLRSGCTCSSGDCFLGLDAAAVHRHRLEMSELTREEQEMYLMGIIHASLRNPDKTSRNRERDRLKANYVFFGKPLCLEAFLYVQNTNNYTLKSLRKHLMTRGLVPRVHGNAGKRPLNAFSLEEYHDVRGFLRDFLDKQANASLVLPTGWSAKKIHAVYAEQFSSQGDAKLMSYTTFRRFLQEQFPGLKYEKAPEKSTEPF